MNTSLSYQSVLTRGWRIFWNHKFLWVLGIIAALGGNGGGGGGNSSSNFNSDFGGTSTGTGPLDPNSPEGQIVDFFDRWTLTGEMPPLPDILSTIIFWSVFAIIVLIILRIALWLLRLVAEAGMIRSVHDISLGSTHDFWSAWRAGRQKFWPMFGTAFLYSLPGLIIGLLIIGSIGFTIFNLVGQAGSITDDEIGAAVAGNIGLFVCLACLAVPYGLLVTFMYPISQRKIVLNDQSVMSSISSAWSFFITHFLDLILLGFIYLVIGFVVGIASLVVMLPIILLTVVPIMISTFSGEFPGVFAIGAAVGGFIALFLIGSAVGGLLAAYRSSTFTLAYMDLTGTSIDNPMTEKSPPPSPYDDYDFDKSAYNPDNSEV